jgi:hypothetical protein
MPKRLSAFVAMTAISTMLLFSGASAIAAPPAPDINDIGLSGVTDAGVPFTGTFDLDRIRVQDGALVAVGTLTGTLGTTAVDAQTVALPLQVTGTCDILHLTLGPLDLDLLGLVVHLDEVVLDITAESGPGNLLGNLLCAVAGLLDNNAPLNSIARLLNQLLGLLDLLG